MQNLVPAERVVAPGVNGAHIARFQRNVVNVIELDAMVIAPEENRAMRVVVNQVVRRAIPHAAQIDRRDVTFGPAALTLEVAILHEVSAGNQRLTIAARERNPTVTGVEDVATDHTVSMTARDDDATVADVSNEAANNAVAFAPIDLDGIGSRGLQNQPAKRDVGNVCKF